MGVLIRSAEALEQSGHVNAVVLDKTGTITAGRPSLTDVLPLGIWRQKPDDLLALAATAEHDSEHPLAAAIIADAKQRGLLTGKSQREAFQVTPGSAYLHGRRSCRGRGHTPSSSTAWTLACQAPETRT